MALVVGGALRGTGVGYGEGVVTHVDEAGIVAALDGIRTHQPLTPFMFFYGGGYLYPMYAFVALAQRVALPAGAIEWREPAGHAFHVLARSWSTVTSTATIALVYVLGGVVGGTAPGVLAAVLMAGMNLAVREAHIA